MALNLVNRHPAVDAALSRWCRTTVLHLLRFLQAERGQVTVVLTTDGEIAVLNERYRGRSGPTNVLSFASEPVGDDLIDSLRRDELGDIVISVDTARAEAKAAGEPLSRRLDRLIAHGLLHLLGHDHERSAAEAARMTAQERELTGSLPHRRRYAMPHLAVNVDHVATVRQARGTNEPDPVTAAAICELAGAMGIVVHLREDRRHIQDRDVRLLRETVKTKLNLEMGAAREIIDFALDLVPDMVTLVPEKRQELTTEGGLDVAGQKKKLSKTVAAMNKAGIPVSLFIDPDVAQVKAAREVGATFVELHTGAYAEATDEDSQFDEFELIRTAAEEAHLSGLRVNAGHGLDYVNTAPVAGIEVIEELSIGHAIIARSLFSGLEEAVRDMVAIVENGGLY